MLDGKGDAENISVEDLGIHSPYLVCIRKIGDGIEEIDFFIVDMGEAHLEKAVPADVSRDPFLVKIKNENGVALDDLLVVPSDIR